MALFYLSAVIPDLGQMVIDRSTIPPTTLIVGRTRDTLLAGGVVAVPLALVFIGTFRRSQLAIPGWILLVVLDVLPILM